MTEFNRHPFGETFKVLRERRGYTLKEAAGDIVSPQFLGQFEQGKKSMALEKFSRLLISIGMDWDDFAENYEGERVMTAYRLMDQLLEEPDFHGFIEHARPKIKEQLKPYYKDRPEYRDFILDLFVMVGHYNHNQSVPKEVVSPKLVHNLQRTTYLSLPEGDAFAFLMDYLPLNYILKVRDDFLVRYEERPDFNNRLNTFGTLHAIAEYLSQKGLHLQAQKTIDEMRNRPSHMDFRMPINRIQMDMLEVYNRLRQDDPSALPQARKTIKLLEHLVDYYGDERYILTLDAFKKGVYRLNKTGKNLW